MQPYFYRPNYCRANVISRKYCVADSYEYLDSGNFFRLERFGQRIIARSCPTAKWKIKNESIWNTKNIIKYTGSSGKIGSWSIGEKQLQLTDIEKDWNLRIGNVSFQLQLSDYGQVGVFPEQSINWIWIQDILRLFRNKNENKETKINVLNGFAYTGGSTLASTKIENVECVHLDGAKSFCNWAKENAHLNSPENDLKIRFIADDCMTFIDREIKRGNKYDALIFDPPAFGRSNGKTWKIDTDFDLLIEKLPQLLTDYPVFVLLSCHDESWNESRLRKSLNRVMVKYSGEISSGELILKPNDLNIANILPLGYYARWCFD